MTPTRELQTVESELVNSLHFYEIRVRGRLDSAYWAEWYDAQVLAVRDGESVLRVPLADQAALFGLISVLRDLAAAPAEEGEAEEGPGLVAAGAERAGDPGVKDRVLDVLVPKHPREAEPQVDPEVSGVAAVAGVEHGAAGVQVHRVVALQRVREQEDALRGPGRVLE